MPIYEYRCAHCGHQLEQLQRMSDAPLRTCPACGKRQLKRLISAAAFRLKGGGWYETDFKKDHKRNLADSAPSEGKPEKAPADKGSAASDKKTDTASTAKPAAGGTGGQKAASD